MQSLRCLFGIFVGMCSGGRSQAMGSGPHPTVPYGLPAATPHELSNVAISVFIAPLLWTALILMVAGLLLWALQARVKK
jgi:hypothetical protein